MRLQHRLTVKKGGKGHALCGQKRDQLILDEGGSGIEGMLVKKTMKTSRKRTTQFCKKTIVGWGEQGRGTQRDKSTWRKSITIGRSSAGKSRHNRKKKPFRRNLAWSWGRSKCVGQGAPMRKDRGKKSVRRGVLQRAKKKVEDQPNALSRRS